ncbi:hypothetical protein SDC9_205374 [bioreactor metagenome]|uniref:Uncharacterized protein n=1 Tax=bioreactor metagenome TaxID=1076179 RepID=A0A645J3I3_9ZZZZ
MLLRLVRCQHACAAEDDDGVLHTLRGHGQIGLEQFQLETDAASLSAQHELGVGKGEAVGVGLQRIASDCEIVDLGPGVGQASVVQIGICFHGVLMGFLKR